MRTIDRIDRNRGYRDYHPGAIYLHKGQQHEIASFDVDRHQPEIVLEPTSVDYYTQADRQVEISDLAVEEFREFGEFRLCWGSGTVNEYYPSYQEHTIYGDESHGPFSTGLNEPVDLTTKLVWVEISDGFGESIRERYPRQPDEESRAQDPFLGGVHAAEHALINMAPTELMIDAKDLGGVSIDRHPETGLATLVIYDSAEWTRVQSSDLRDGRVALSANT